MSSFPESFKYVSAEGACEKLWPEGRAVLSMQHTWQGDWNLSPHVLFPGRRKTQRSPKDLDARQFPISLPRKWFSGQLFLEWVFAFVQPRLDY